jgi:hypothetical protein
MHRMGCLGPIDPSVTNSFNPIDSRNPGHLLPISVEDVSAYFKLIRSEIGITHEDELVKTVIAMTDKVHPLALGNVQRHHQQSRMMARKLLKKHMAPDKGHEIELIIDHLKSNLFFHGHPISRREAEEDLKLKVVRPSPELEACMWDLYLHYDAELKLREPFFALHEFETGTGGPAQTAPKPVGIPELVKQMTDLAKAGLGLGAVNEAQLVALATACIPVVNSAAQPQSKVHIDRLKGGLVESRLRTDTFLTDLTIERTTVVTPQGPQPVTRQEVRWQRWEQEKT